MRFIYIDSRGNEVEVASVEALAARIQLGAINPETRLYDEAADLWAPAEAHPVYRQIVREGVEPGQSMGRVRVSGEMPGDAPGPVTMRDEGRGKNDPATPSRSDDVPRADIPGLVGHTGTVDGSFEAHEDAADTQRAPADIAALAPDAPAGTTAPTPEVLEASSLAPDVAPAVAEPEPAKPAPAPSAHEPDAFDLGLPEEDAPEPTPEARTPPSDRVEEPERRSEPPEWTDDAQVPSRERRSFGGASDSPPGWDAEAPEKGEAVPVPAVAGAAKDSTGDDAFFELTSLGETFEQERRGSSDDDSGPILPAPGPRVRRRGFWDFVDSRAGSVMFVVMALLAMVTAGTSGQQPFLDRAMWVFGGVAAAAAVASLGLAWNRRNRFLIPPATLVLTIALSSYLVAQRRGEQMTTEALAELERAVADLQATRAEPDPENVADTVAFFPEVSEDLSGAAFQAMTEAMRAYQAELGLPDAPPRSWLEGIYLARASRFPGVGEYWEGVRGYIFDLQEMEDSLYQAGVESKVALDGLTGADSVQQVSDAMIAFRARDTSRALAYDQVQEVAASALYLHDLLIAREDDIEYDPFTREGVSRDPVLEAVPTDSVLRNEMNSRIDRLTQALDHLNALAAVRTRRLQEILFSRLLAAMMAAPPPPDSLTESR